jgi:tetratricopeptide (TPR) repeat protein
MNETSHTWRDLRIKRNTRVFVGRENVMEHFRLNCLDSVPRDLITVLHGRAGVGKSATLARLREIGQEYGIFSTYIGGSAATPVGEKTILRVMDSISQQFSANGTPLTQFTERYHEYTTAIHQISDDSASPGPPFDAIGGLHDRDAWYSQTWDIYLNERYQANLCALVREPVAQLTPLFIRDLNTWAVVKRILLCFDDWQQFDAQLGEWLRVIMLDGSFSTKIWVILATRDVLSAEWDSLRSLLRLHQLPEFTEAETRAYLQGFGNVDSARVSDIVVFSNGLPVLVQLLSSVHAGLAGDLALSPLDRYFKWLTQEQRKVVLLASVARYIDAQVLDVVLGGEGGKWFEWLKCANILIQKGDHWIYHPALRGQFLTWARREIYDEIYHAHGALRVYYQRDKNKGGTDTACQYGSISTSLLESVYHGLVTGEPEVLRQAVLDFVTLLRSDYSLAGELLEVWLQAAQIQENPNAVVEWAKSLEEMWDAIYLDDWSAATACCEEILKDDALDADIKSVIKKLISAIQARFPQPAPDMDQETLPIDDSDVALLAENRIIQHGDKEVSAVSSLTVDSHSSESMALNSQTTKLETTSSAETKDLNEEKKLRKVAPSVQLLHQHVRALDETAPSYSTEEWLQSADEYYRKGAYSEALDAYDKALKLDPILTPAHIGRACALTQLGDLSAAFQSYKAALNTEPDNVFALRNRGWLYMRQQDYGQALEDYDRAVSIAPDDVTLIYARANVHYRLKDYTNALKDYDEVIRRDSSYIEAYLNRGVTHAVLREYRRAIADFNQVIILDPNNGYAYHHRGRAYSRLQQLALAHDDYDRALELVPNFVGIYIDLGLLYTRQAEYQKALDVYHQAIALDPTNAIAYYNAACVAALLGNIQEACRKLDLAIELHPPYREMAAKDSDFTSIRDTPEFQKRLISSK